ncbi:MAG: hypothetical protein RLZ51_1892 [Pseudomonadota bacterium]|jgi:hypothetical protein
MAIVELGGGLPPVEVPDEVWNALSPEDQERQRQAIREAVSQGVTKNEPPPTERGKAFMQGLTLGAWDEIKGAASGAASWMSGDGYTDAYNQSVEAERNALEAYRAAYPYSSLAWEGGGALAPTVAAMLAAPFTGGSSAAAVAPTAGRLAAIGRSALHGAKVGGATGAVYGFNSGEGDIGNRFGKAVADGLVGAGGGAVIGGAMTAVGQSIFKPAVDWIRRKSGDRMAGVVSAEIQRLAQRGGLTPDEVIEGVRNGTLMAENKTLGLMIRKFYSEGGEAQSLIRNRLDARPAETRKAALDAVQGELADPGNPLANKRVSDEAAAIAERDAYAGALFRPDGTPIAPASTVISMLEMVARDAPEALTNAAKAARLKYGIKPFFTEKDGVISFTRTPTLAEAESTFRALRDLTSKAYKDSSGDIGEGYGLFRDMLKQELDNTSLPLKAARAEAAIVRHANDFFKLGQTAAGKTPDELELIMRQIAERDAALATDEGLKAFRAGLVAALRGQLSRPSTAPGVIRDLAEPSTGRGTALRLALPDGAEGRVVPKLEVARDAQAARDTIIGGSQTAQTTMSQGIGDNMGVAQDAASAIGGSDLFAWARLLSRLVGDRAPNLSEAQRMEIARIVLSDDPLLVERALKDNSLIGVLEKKVVNTLDGLGRAGARVSPIVAEQGLLSDR